jgi:hypothetical protein
MMWLDRGGNLVLLGLLETEVAFGLQLGEVILEVDAGVDAGVDAEVDAGVDAGVDAVLSSGWGDERQTGELCGSGPGAALWACPERGHAASHPDAKIKLIKIKRIKIKMTTTCAAGPHRVRFYAASHTVMANTKLR